MVASVILRSFRLLVTTAVLAALPLVESTDAIAQSQTLSALEQRVQSLHSARKLDEALPLAQELVRRAEAELGSKHTSVLRARTTLGSILTEFGRFVEAEALLRRSLAIVETEPSQQQNLGVALASLAECVARQGRYAEAEPLFLRSIAAVEQTLGPSHLEVAKALRLLSVFYWRQGRYGEAESAVRRSLAIVEKAGATTEQQWALAADLNQLAIIQRGRGRDSDVETLYRRSLTLAERALGPNHPAVAAGLNNLAEILREQARYGEVEAIARRSLAIREKALGAMHPDLAFPLHQLASAALHRGDFPEAEALTKRSVSIRESALGSRNPQTASSLNALAVVYARQGRLSEAESLAMRSLAITEATLSDSPRLLPVLRFLAALYVRQDRPGESEALLKRGLDIAEARLGSEHEEVAQLLNGLADLDVRRARWQSAVALARRAAAINVARTTTARRATEPSGHEIQTYRSAFFTLAEAAWGLGIAEPLRNAELMDEGFAATQRVRHQVVAAAVAQMAVRFGAGTSALSVQVREHQDAIHARKALDQQLIVALGNAAGKRNEAEISALRSARDTAEQNATTISTQLVQQFPAYAELTAPAPLAIADVQRLLGADEALITWVPIDNKTFAWAVTRERADWQQLAITPESLTTRVAALRRGVDIEDLQRAMSTGNAEPFDLGLAHDLYRELLAPFLPSIEGKRNLLLVPSGPLTSLPFHLLLTDKPVVARPTPKDLAHYARASWLVRRHAVTVLPSVASLRALREFARASPATRPMIGYGDPTFTSTGTEAKRSTPIKSATRSNRARGYATYWQGGDVDPAVLSQGLSSLPETAGELRAVANALGAPASDLHLGAAASETAVKRADLESYRVVYFATHGLVAGEVKGLGEPALVLSRPQRPTAMDDGLLTASEVAQLKLNADWVVLSACNTAGGDRPEAEALSGLTRAFFYAGARTLLVSHWRVDSRAAVRLTTTTFSNLKLDPSISRAEALRRAMLGMIEDASDPWNAYPDLWAAFSIVGEGAR